MDPGNIGGMTAKSTLESGLTTRWMARDIFIGPMEETTKASSNKIGATGKAPLRSGTAEFTPVDGIRASNTVLVKSEIHNLKLNKKENGKMENVSGGLLSNKKLKQIRFEKKNFVN